MIRPATVETLGTLTTLARKFYASSAFLGQLDESSWVGMWRDILTADVGVIFVASDDVQPIGAIGGIVHKDPTTGRMTASEMFWFVQPESRGIGVTLYRSFEEWARQRHCVDIRMVHLSDSMPVKIKAFYEAIGYREVETHYVKELK